MNIALNVADVLLPELPQIDNLTSNLTNRPLTAKQGNVLRQYIESIVLEMIATYTDIINGTKGNKFISVDQMSSLLSQDYTYNDLTDSGRPQTITYKNGDVVKCTYTDDGQLSTYETKGYIVTYHYNENNYLIGKTTTVKDSDIVNINNTKTTYTDKISALNTSIGSSNATGEYTGVNSTQP